MIFLRVKSSTMHPDGEQKDPAPSQKAWPSESIHLRGVSFVMTLWLEGREVEGPPEWRWRVRHVQSGEERCFCRLTEVLSYIEEKARIAPPAL